MEINGKDLSLPMDAYTRQAQIREASEAREGVRKPAPGNGAIQDRVALSDRVALARELAARASALDEVDDGRVAALRARIAAGEYRIDSGRIADRMLESSALYGLV